MAIEPSARKQLVQARRDIEDQVCRLKAPREMAVEDNSYLIDRLEDQLREINALLGDKE